MDEQAERVSQEFTPHKGFIKTLRIDRFGKIFSNLMSLCGVCAFFCVLASIVIPLFHGIAIIFAIFAFMLAVIFLSIFTFGLIYLDPDNIIYKLFNFIKNTDSEKTLKISDFFISMIPYICIGGLVFAALSVLMMILNKQKNCLGRIVLISILAIFFVISLIIYFKLGGKLWQN